MPSVARGIRTAPLLFIWMLLTLAVLAPDATRSPAYAQLTGTRALVADWSSGVCRIVDATTGEIVTTFACGTGAEGVDVNSTGTRAVIGACAGPTELRLFDLTATPPTSLGTISAGVNCVEEVDISPNDQFGIAPGSEDGKVSKFTLSPFVVTGTSVAFGSGSRFGSLQDVHIDTTSAQAVLPMFDNDDLLIIDVTGPTPTELGKISTPNVRHHGIALSAGDNNIFLASRLPPPLPFDPVGGITVASRSDRSVIAILSTAPAEAIDITCDGRRAVAETTGGLAWINMTTSPPTVLSANFGPARTDGFSTSTVAFSRDGSLLFVGGGNAIDIYNTASDPPTLLRSIANVPNVNIATLPCRALAAANDAYPTNEDTALSIAAPGVLANDTGSGLTAVLVAGGEHGSVTLNADGSFTYVPNPNFNGLDSFLYAAKMGTTESNIATVMINVGAVNDPPFFNPIPDQFVNSPVNENQTVDITGVSAGPPDEAQQTLTFTATSSTALISDLIISGEGSTRTLTYQRAGTGSGTAKITVTAQDNGGTESGGAAFERTFEITLGAAGAVQATVTNFSPNPDPTKAPTVTVQVTASPIDFDGNGVQCPADAYRFFRPRKPGQPYNVIPSNADRVPESPPWRIPDDTDEVCDATLTYTVVLDLSDWMTGATGTTDIVYVSIIRDPELSPTGVCPTGATCDHRIWTGVKPAGSITFTTADKVAVKNTVTLKTFDTVTKASTSTRLAHIPIRVFDIKDPELQKVAGDAIKSTANSEPRISFSSLSKVLGTIYEADKGRIGACQTDDSGLCFAGQAAPAYDLIIAKFRDDDTGQTVYVGDIKRPKDFVNGIAAANLVIVKLFKNGVFEGYGFGILLRVE